MKPGQLSEHFFRDEWACECGCGFDTVDAELVRVLERTHSYFSEHLRTKIRIIITSGNRCKAHNEIAQKQYNHRYVPFSSQSVHMVAKACDFKVEYQSYTDGAWCPIHADKVADYIERTYPDCYGIGRYNGRCHLDTRTGKARWDKR